MNTRNRSLLVLALALLCWVLAATSASALTVKVDAGSRTDNDQHGGPEYARVGYEFTITDPEGVADAVRIEAIGADAIRISDPGVAITADPLCAPQSDGAVVCRQPHPDLPVTLSATGTIDLGAGNDSVVLSPVYTWPRPWHVSGGDGDDAIRAAASSSNDLKVDWVGGPGADSADGSAVTVDYTDRTTPVHVTVGQGADDGADGEGDTVGGEVFAVLGSAGNDVIRRTGAEMTLTGSVGRMLLDGGLGDDTVSTDRYGSILRGGPEYTRLQGVTDNNTLRGGPEADELQGGFGTDDMDGGAGDDFLVSNGRGPVQGGAGDDRMMSAPGSAAQVLDGGPGFDHFSSFNYLREASMSISLDGVANDGIAGEGDNLLGVESVEIDYGTLIGSDGPDTLVARRGSVYGLGGSDTVRGGVVADGGSGSDTIGMSAPGASIAARDGEADTINCRFDVGRPVPAKALVRDRADKVAGCYPEAQVRLASPPVKRVLRAVLTCPAGAASCSGTAYLKDKQLRIVASADFAHIAPGTERTIVLTRRRASAWVRAVVRARSPWTPGESHVTPWYPKVRPTL